MLAGDSGKCACGRRATKRKANSWICDYCFALESEGFCGGPYGEFSGVKPLPLFHRRRKSNKHVPYLGADGRRARMDVTPQ